MSVRGSVFGGVFAFAFALTPSLFAQPSQNTMVAEALFEDGQKLMVSGKTAEACEKFAASQKLDPAIGTLLNLAACHEKLGRTATAWLEFNDALSQSTQQGDKPRASFAKSHANALEKQLYRVVIEVLKPNKNMQVKLDGTELAKEALGTGIPLDPGEHTIEATQPGRKPFKRTVNPLPSGGTDRIQVPELQEIEYGFPHPDAPPQDQQQQQQQTDQPPPKQESTKKGGTNPMMIAGMATLGVGVVGGVLGTIIFGSMASSAAADRDKLCPPKSPNPCRTQKAFDLDYDANVNQTMMIVSIVGGGALAIAGGALLGLSFLKKPSQTSGLLMAPSISPWLTGIQVGGSF